MCDFYSVLRSIDDLYDFNFKFTDCTINNSNKCRNI